MGNRLFLIAMAAGAMFSHTAQAQPTVVSCEAKRADISRDIEDARAKNQKQRQRGLEKALRETQASCSDRNLQKEHAARIARQERKVADRQRELDQARAQGKADKISSREARLTEESLELQKLRGGTR